MSFETVRHHNRKKNMNTLVIKSHRNTYPQNNIYILLYYGIPRLVYVCIYRYQQPLTSSSYQLKRKSVLNIIKRDTFDFMKVLVCSLYQQLRE